jgi:hypothetical protein
MAKQRNTTVTHPDGSVSKRGSVSATYTHAVVIGPVDPAVRAAHLLRQAEAQEARAAQFAAAADAGLVKVKNRGFGSKDDVGYDGKPSYHGYEVFLDGTKVPGTKGRSYFYVSDHSNSKGEVERYVRDADGKIVDGPDGYGVKEIVPGREHLIERGREAAADAAKNAADLRASAAKWLAGETTDTTYGVVRWSRRADLAQKAAAGEFAYAAERGAQVYVVAVDA